MYLNLTDKVTLAVNSVNSC